MSTNARNLYLLVLISFVILALTATSPLSVQAQPGNVLSHQKISDIAGNFGGDLDDEDYFGHALAPLGDFDGDLKADVAVGAPLDDDGGVDFGAIYLLFLNNDGTVKEFQKISADSGGFTGNLGTNDRFSQVASLGDLDGDGITDLAVGAYLDDSGLITNTGGVWILFLNANGTVKSQRKINNNVGGFGGGLDANDRFGWSVARLGDLDGDGLPELAVGADQDDDGGGTLSSDYGAVWILFLNSDGTVKAEQKISDTEGGFTGILELQDLFGYSVAPLGDLDLDGVRDLAVGARNDDDGGFNCGAVWILFLNADGTVKGHQKISALEGGFTGTLDPEDWFCRVTSLPDIDGDHIQDLMVGAPQDDDGLGWDNSGALWILFLDRDGTVKGHQKISRTAGGFTGALDSGDQFGWSGALLGDLNGNGRAELAVGAQGDGDGGPNRGAVWVLSLDGPVLTAAPDVISSSTLSLANSPNPFRGRTVLQYALPTAAAVRLRIFDSQGRQVATLVDGEETAGRHVANWSGHDTSGVPVSAGVYYARLEADGISAARKIVVLK